MASRLQLLVAFCLTLSLFPSPALLCQDRRVVVVKPGDADLRREAARLRMCPEQLKNLRQALDEAVELLPEAGGMAGQMSIGHFLFRFDRTHAEETTIRLTQELGNKARQASTSGDYTRLTSVALQLISALQRTNPSLAARLEEQWPEDPTGGAPQGSGRVNTLARQRFFQTAQNHPEEALRQLSSVEPESQYGARATLLRSLVDKDMEPEARRLIEQTLSVPLESISQMTAQQYGEFGRTVLEQYPEYSEQIYRGLASVYQGLSQSGIGAQNQSTTTLPNGQVLKLSSADQFILNLAMMTGDFDQQFATRLAELSPAISQRMQAAGGYRGLFNYNSKQMRQAQRKLLETPDEQLESSLQDSTSSMDLLRTAGQLCYEAPEKAERIFDLMLKRIQGQSDLRQAINEFQNGSSSCARCLGLLPDKWFSAGKALLDKARQQEQESAPVLNTVDGRVELGHPRAMVPTLSAGLEASLIAFKADTDFAGAMQEIRAIEDKSRRYQILFRVVQRLGNR